MHSALNQPLDAEIELLEVGDLNDSEIKIRLASAEDFERAGVDRFLFLNDLRFSPVIRGSASRIRVVSSKPVREPYLNFIVEVARPNGKLLREYTLLLDPPGSAFTPIAAPVSPARATAVAAASIAPVQPKPAPAATQGKRYEVVRGDSLWLIAKRLSVGSGMTQQQMLEGIYTLNPQAFSGGDINRLRAGESLLLPDGAVQATAPAAVAQSAAPTPTSTPVPAVATPADPALDELTQAQQRVDSSIAQGEAERAALRQQLAELQAELDAMQQRLSGSDEQVTALRNQLQQMTAAPVVEPAKAEPAAAVPVVMPAAQAAEQPAPAPLQESNSGISPFWWAIMVSGLLLLFLLDWVLLRRSRRDAQELELEEAQTAGKAKVAFQHRHEEARPVAPVMPQPAPVAASVTAAAPLQVVSAPAAKAAPDALEGANIYIAYGRWREALAVLQPAVAQEPDRVDLRFRLLEVLGELRDPVAFTLEEAALRERHADQERLAAIVARYADLGSAAASSEPVFELDETIPAEASNEPIDDLQSDFDGYPLDADWEQVSPFKTDEPKRKATVVQAFPTVEDDLGFPANLQELPEVFELTLDADTLSPFGELPELAQAEGLDELTAEFVDPMVSLEELDKLDARQENITKLNLALAYIEQGNIEAACSILNEVISDGDDEQKQEARDLLAKIA
ncbi:FimV/HubP family polar landmark protein [Pseudomonas sp. CR1201]